MAVKTYNPKDVQLIIGVDIIEGFAEGSFITIEYDEDFFTKKVGADGEVARARNANQTATLTLKLMQTSKSNLALTALMQVDLQTGAGVVPIILKEGFNLVFSEDGWIKKPPSMEMADEISEREWTFDMGQTDMVQAGN